LTYRSFYSFIFETPEGWRFGTKIGKGSFKTNVQCVMLLRAFVGECD
jgi:hypothetical protein